MHSPCLTLPRAPEEGDGGSVTFSVVKNGACSALDIVVLTAVSSRAKVNSTSLGTHLYVSMHGSTGRRQCEVCSGKTDGRKYSTRASSSRWYIILNRSVSRPSYYMPDVSKFSSKKLSLNFAGWHSFCDAATGDAVQVWHSGPS